MADQHDRPPGEEADKLRVVFVCSGNICRSPMAEIVFREQLRRAGLSGSVAVSSAGTGPWHVGEPADGRAIATLTANGYHDGAAEHVAAQIGRDHLSADLLLAADNGHARELRALLPGQTGKVALLRGFDPEAPEGAEVPDPYYGGDDAMSGFTDVLGMIERAMPALLDWVRERR
ncbi:protein tyrosine phosphatase [Prauserella marina]|uniref:protein-tyrosine-phosphatase n=1 Tax=Prauserella marina TaxID=530584 RepID=A0A222VKE1_9PSEU|nr:low molecular weight protein-tyrosine-phosphatase [Prauserella marina]ASR34367.1 protein tyrosine phosphatase [Prauserella marina]PWV71841.1 protein-tyrosine phosphatase [Prauserella marina]SDD89099.1 protein-tyrosine phosphatase [Prauserella marina]